MLIYSKSITIYALLSKVTCKQKIAYSAIILTIYDWWALRDSNPRPSRCKRDALAN